MGRVNHWFVCHCGRRVQKLWLPADESVFRCRTCHNLTHRSAQTHNRLEYALAKDEKKLYAALTSTRRSTRFMAMRALLRRVRWDEKAQGKA
jgi:hypothetical protein